MHRLLRLHPLVLASALTVLSGASAITAHADATAANGAAAADGRQDFDWDIGTWKTHQKRLLHPLTGSKEWVEYEGTDVVRQVWDGANLGEIKAEGSGGHLELLTLRLFNPETHEWSIYFTSRAGGALSVPAVGMFKNGRGDFYDQESYNGRTVLLRFSVFDITADSCHFQQAFSADGGKSWEVNFDVTETRQHPGSVRG